MPETPANILGVMVSSTFTDLEAHRATLIKALHGQKFFAFAMENDSAKLADVIESSLQMVAESAAYIGLLAHKYGQVPEDPIRNPQSLSITELEFNEAQRLGRPILLFLMSDDHALTVKDVEPDSVKRDKLTAFKNRAKNMSLDSKVHRVYYTFKSVDDFAINATKSIAELRRHLEKPRNPPIADTEPRPSQKDPIPSPPSLYAEPRYLVSHEFIGRQAQLDALNDWAIPSDPHPIIFFDAIGGTGKSMLTWHWLTHHAPKVRPDLAGRLWYSFYERGAQMSDFCRHALAYITGVEPKSLNQLKTPELAAQLLHHLQAKPWLFILDGIERILVAYNRIDAAQLTDDQASHPTDEISNRNPTSAIRPEDDDLLRALATAAPSKIVITSRLVPQAFLNRAGQPIPGVLRLPLPGLRPTDAEALFRSCGIKGDSKAIQDYLKTNCDCHPLVISALAGLINDYLPDGGNFNAWLANSGQLNFTDLDLVQKRNHILQAATDAVSPNGRRILALLSLLSESIDYETLQALTEEFLQPKELTSAIANLKSRGLLLYEAKRFDLHPVVRGVVAESLQLEDRNRFGQQVVDHFSSKPQSPYEEAGALKDLTDGLQLVRTFVKIGELEKAYNIYRGSLSEALFFNLEAYSQVLSLLKPFFPSSWSALPTSISEREASFLANEAALALGRLGDFRSSLDAYGATLISGLCTENWPAACVRLGNIAGCLAHQNKLAKSTEIAEMEFELAIACEDENSIFVSLLDRFVLLAKIGHWSQAQSVWNQVDPMGRDWSRSAYRPGYAELWHTVLLFWEGSLQEEQLAMAEGLLKVGKDRALLREGHSVRGEWNLERGEWNLAASSLHEAVAMARAVGLTDAPSETQLALARFHLNQLPDPNQEADRLANLPNPDHLSIAELYHALGDSDRAKHHALAAYKWYWADGEPYVYRYYLNKSRTLLEKLNVPIPNLPPYDPSKREPFRWEPAVHAAIAKLRAEKEAKARAKQAGTE